MKSIYEAHLALKNKKMSALELLESCLSNRSEKNNAFISVTEDRAKSEAIKADEKIARGEWTSYLQGIPYSLKDLFVTEGLRTTAASKILYNYIPPYEGFVASAFKNAGAVLVGKVSLDEFGMGSTNENSAFGPVLNPLNATRVPGGSSGGSAASIAEGSSLVSMGTDTGGSSRLPANFCGIVGFKPSYGRVSRFGQIAYASSLDQASPMGNSVLDIGIVMEHLSKKDPHDASQVNLGQMKIVEDLLKIDGEYFKGKKIGLCMELIDGCKEDVKKALLQALDLMKNNGATIVNIELPHLKYSVSSYYIIATCEASANLSRYDGIHYGYRKSHNGQLEDTYKESRSLGFGEEVKKRILLGTYSLSSGYYDAYYSKACKVRRLIAQDFNHAFLNCDVIFSPVCASTAFELGEGPKDPVQMYMNDLYTIPANLAGLPALALPFGNGADQMPTGFQLIGKQFGDEALLKLGRSFEVLTGKKF